MPHYKVMYFYSEEDDEYPEPWRLVIEVEEESNLTPDEYQVTELEVEGPRPVQSSGISYIFEFSSSCSHESVAESFISLGSIELLDSFNSFFLPFFRNIKNPNSTCPAPSEDGVSLKR